MNKKKQIHERNPIARGDLDLSQREAMLLQAQQLIHDYFAVLGSKGGKKSKRKLTSKQARDMVKAREVKKKK